VTPMSRRVTARTDCTSHRCGVEGREVPPARWRSSPRAWRTQMTAGSGAASDRGAQLLLESGRCACLDARAQRRPIDVEDAIQPAQVNRDHPGEPIADVGFHPADDTGAPPYGSRRRRRRAPTPAPRSARARRGSATTSGGARRRRGSRGRHPDMSSVGVTRARGCRWRTPRPVPAARQPRAGSVTSESGRNGSGRRSRTRGARRRTPPSGPAPRPELVVLVPQPSACADAVSPRQPIDSRRIALRSSAVGHPGGYVCR